ncbi:MAG: hypothetical protein JST42_17950 [Bacteroidetes bacterium]|nr:hypothetical protein [Bacteroidota bacterium]
MDYYRIFDDIRFPNRWYLGDINVPDPWNLRMGKSLDQEQYKNLEIEIDQEGRSMDLTLTDGRLVPIVSERFVQCLHEFMDEVQLFPVKVPGTTESYYILVIKNALDCVDEENSDFEKFEPGNDIRPDLAGQYSAMRVLKVDPARIDRHIFRIAKYEVAAIVSGEVKDRLEKAQLRGLKFSLVSWAPTKRD